MDGFFGIGAWEMLVIAAIALIVLGPKQMILMSRKAGEYLRQFRELWTQLSAAWQKELDGIDGRNVVAEVSQEIQGLKSDVQKTIQTLQGEVTTAMPTIAPPTTAKPTMTPTPMVSEPTPMVSEPTLTEPAAPSPNSNGSSAETKPEQPASTPASPQTKRTYSAWVDKSSQR